MHFILRLFLWILPLFIWGGLELAKIHNDWWWIVLSVLSVFIFLGSFFSCKFRLNKTFFQFFIFPLIFLITSFGFLLLVNNDLSYHLLVILVCIIIHLLYRQYYIYFYWPFKYQPYSLESLAGYVSIASIFFISVALYGSQVLLGLPGWILTLILLVFFCLIFQHFFWINKIDWKKSWPFVLILLLIAAEVFVATSYLPTSYFVNAFILTSILYVLLGFTRAFLVHNLDKKLISYYLIISAAALIIVLATATWD